MTKFNCTQTARPREQQITTTMKKKLFYLLLLMLSIPNVEAQIRLMGVNKTNNSDKIDIVTWNMFDSSSVTCNQTDLTSYALATSGFSDYSGQYHISGLSPSGMGLLIFNTFTNTTSFTIGSFLSNITEFDMSTGIMYKLSIEINKTVSVVAHTMSPNQDSLIGTFVEPNLMGLVVDAICFDANKGVIYHIGMNQNNSKDLYAIYVRDTSFTYTKIPIIGEEDNYFSGLQFDNVNNKIYGRRANFDSASTYLGSDIVEINSVSGAITVKTAITQFSNFLGGSSCFDQNTSTFMIIGVDDNFTRKMIAYNTLTDSLFNGYVPVTVSELACINTRFAQFKYGTPTGIKKINRAEAISIYPNPAIDELHISIPPEVLANELQVELINGLGEIVYRSTIEQHQSAFQISGLERGIYFYRIMDKTQPILTGKLCKE